MLVSAIAQKVVFSYSSQSLFSASFQQLGSTRSHSLGLTLHQYLHVPTKARIYHFQNSDCERAFASVIKTYPKDNKGSPHILEHLACCGSHKYPIRDPFFNMIKRSVNSYMNAWTGDDFTAYPFASPNRIDWQNLYQVYLDMSMNPLLNPLDFRQEGWRLQLNEEGERQLKGIVLNEMKGAYQDADRQMMGAISQELLRGTPYAFDSGGKPESIVQLKYSELKDIYQHYYHPSNMSFYFYGEGQIKNQLNFLHEEYLAKYQDRSQVYNSLKIEPQSVKNKYKDIITHTSECNSIAISLNLGMVENISPEDFAALRLISYLVLEKTNALAYKHFIESGIAQTIGYSGLNEGKIATFTLTLKGIYPDFQAEEFENQFMIMLKELSEGGVSQERVKEYLHQTRVRLATPRQTNGIKLLEDTIYLMNHRLNFQPFLNQLPILETVAAAFQDSQKVQSLLERYFFGNNQRVIVRQLMADSEQPNEEIRCPLEVPEESIRRSQQDLKERQSKEQDPSVLPTLRIADLQQLPRKKGKLIEKLNSQSKQYEQYHVSMEEDINFYRLVFNFEEPEAEWEKRLMLWTYAINRHISTASYTYNQLGAQLSTYTSGFNVFYTLGNSHDLNLIFQFSCLKENIGTAFALLEEIILAPVFEKEHTLNTFKSFSNETVEGLIQNPMEQCMAEAAGYICLAASRINSYRQIKQSLALIKNEDLQGLRQVSDRLLRAKKVSLIEHSNQQPITAPLIISKLLQGESKLTKPSVWSPQAISKAITHNYSVSFCTQHYPSPKFLSSDYAHIGLFLQLLQQQYLHPKIRQQGGAYGSGARIKNGNTIALSSYLDPNCQSTFKVFDESVEDLISHKLIEDRKLTEAKIMQLAEVDRVRAPQNQGINQILKKFSDHEFENYREALKRATFEDLKVAGKKYLRKELSSRCVFGKECPEGFIEERLRDYLI